MLTQKFIKIFRSVQEIGLFSFFKNLKRSNASANPKWHLAISWATSCQYQCVCKTLSKYSKRFKSYRHFSRTGRWQNLHKQAGDKIKCLIIGHTMKVNPQFQLTFLGSCNKSNTNIKRTVNRLECSNSRALAYTSVRSWCWVAKLSHDYF